MLFCSFFFFIFSFFFIFFYFFKLKKWKWNSKKHPLWLGRLVCEETHFCGDPIDEVNSLLCLSSLPNCSHSQVQGTLYGYGTKKHMYVDPSSPVKGIEEEVESASEGHASSKPRHFLMVIHPVQVLTQHYPFQPALFRAKSWLATHQPRRNFVPVTNKITHRLCRTYSD